MPKGISKDLIYDLTEKLIKQAGCILIEVEVKKSADKIILGLIIDKKNGVVFKDCEIVTKLVEPILNESENIKGRYDFFSVSSAGIDRPFKTTQDYINHIDKKIEVKLYSAVENKKLFKQKLLKANDDYIVLEYKKNNIKIKKSNIIKANIAIEF